MIAIQRQDTKQWAIPGGMVDAGEEVKGGCDGVI
jgi:ADP-ribose pyrophosphatase YjhB (NUDIX family)